MKKVGTKNLLGYIVIVLIFFVGFFYLSREISSLSLKVSNLKDRNAELNSQLAASGSRVEGIENNMVLLKDEGFVEIEDLSAINKNIVPAVVFILDKSSSVSGSNKRENVLSGEQSDIIGTGFFISSDGYIATAKHVISDRNVDDIVVEDIGGIRYEVETIFPDKNTDIALIKIKSGGDHKVIVFGYFNNIEIGKEIGVVGFNPGFNVPLLHTGNISAKGTDDSGSQIFTINSFVNKGNSGSPVFSVVTGRVLGILSSRKSEAQVHKLLDPDQFNSGVSLGGGIDPVRFSAELYNANVKIVEEVSQVGIGIVYSLDRALSMLNEIRGY